MGKADPEISDVVDGVAQVRIAVGEGAVDAVLDAEAARVRLVDARRRLVVAQVVASFRVARRPVQVRTIVSVLAQACPPKQTGQQTKHDRQ